MADAGIAVFIDAALSAIRAGRGFAGTQPGEAGYLAAVGEACVIDRREKWGHIFIIDNILSFFFHSSPFINL
jgi:hypothetical protein